MGTWGVHRNQDFEVGDLLVGGRRLSTDLQTLDVLAGTAAPIVRVIPIAFDTVDIATGATLVTPAAGEVLLSYAAHVSEAWDSASSDSLDIGITGNTDALVDAFNAQTPGIAAVGTDGADGAPYMFDGSTAVLATVTSSGGSLSAGAATLTMITVATA